MKKQRHTFLGLVFLAVFGIGVLPFQMHLCQLPHKIQTSDTCLMQETATSDGCCSHSVDVVSCSMTPVVNDADGQAQTAMTCQCSFVIVTSSMDVFLPTVDTKYPVELPMQSSRVVADQGFSGDGEYVRTFIHTWPPYPSSSPLFLLKSSFLI